VPDLIWIGIAICLIHSGLFSGLNLALIGLGRLRLEAEANGGNVDAKRILTLRQDAHLLLATLLWGNVAVNCLLTILSDSVMAGVTAFVVSTVGITLVGEILPQAYFSRNALRAGAAMLPLVHLYQFLLYPIAKPTAMVLDWWLGLEAVQYFRESDLRELIEIHTVAPESDVGATEGRGVLNFLALDDLSIAIEGEPINPLSVIQVADADVLPAFERSPDDSFLRRVQASGEKWVVLVDDRDSPGLVIDADGFLRGALLEGEAFQPRSYCHRALVVTDPSKHLDAVLRMMRVDATHPEDDVIDRDVVLLWTPANHRVVTGADILGRLMRGIAARAVGE
jgi:CBS domain containing-hemolysin-like protein